MSIRQYFRRPFHPDNTRCKQGKAGIAVDNYCCLIRPGVIFSTGASTCKEAGEKEKREHHKGHFFFFDYLLY